MPQPPASAPRPCWLVSTVGGSPKTVTQMVWALEIIQGLSVERVFLLRTSRSGEVPEEERRRFPGVTRWKTLPLRTKDVDTSKGVERVRRGTYRHLQRLLSIPGRPRVCFDISGGRKVMSVALHAAAQLLAGEGDPVFFVEALCPRLRDPESSKWVPVKRSDVSLVEVPFPRLAFVDELMRFLPEAPGKTPLDPGALDGVARNGRFLAERGAIALAQHHEIGKDLRSLRVELERGEHDKALRYFRRIEAVFAALEDVETAATEGASSDFVTDLWPDVRGLAEALDLAVSCSVPAGTRMSGRRDLLLLPLLNLVRNAHKAEARSMQFRLRKRPPGLLISNDGRRIDDHVARRIGTAPGVSTQEGRLHGYGLWLARRIAEAHGGSFRQIPSARGACFAWEFE